MPFKKIKQSGTTSPFSGLGRDDGTCSMTSGAIQQGVPTKVWRDLALERSPPAASQADTPKSAIWIWPSVPSRMLPA